MKSCETCHYGKNEKDEFFNPSGIIVCCRYPIRLTNRRYPESTNRKPNDYCDEFKPIGKDE